MSKMISTLKDLSQSEKQRFFSKPLAVVADIFFDGRRLKASRANFDTGIYWAGWDSACEKANYNSLVGLPRLAAWGEISPENFTLLVKALRMLLSREVSNRTFKDFL